MLFSRKPSTSVSKRHLLMVAVGFSTVLTGCATSPTSKVASSTKVEYYPNCYEPVQHLRATEGDMTKSVITGAAVGAVGGALLGALSGDSDKRGRNAAIGAAGGALAGGAVGYYNERQKQIADDNQRIASYAADVNKSVSDIDRSTAYAKSSQQCYQSAFTKLVADRKAKTVNDTEGRKRLAEIVAGLKESNDLIVAVNGKASEDLNNYTQAYEKDLQQVGVQRTDVVTVATAETTPVVTTKTKKAVKPAKKRVLPTVPKEAVTTEKTLQTAKAKQDESKQVASAGTTQVNSMCKNPDLGDWAPVPCPNV
ncbi:type VI secretion system-associated lipoprotein TagQ [Pseudomonas corrugata]|uniref:YMGG-like Gly-zipper domain-containing protein n=1 Tax=Pseudomonas corrugata TaxID=47879 RepID=A0A3M3E632_9PSED|nr:type VI secretion system-associated lipoprotein TagQ [Pseudomonas corrugata]AOE62951.1 type VI secretion-associated lipoprotein TagQ [Pseudomonas corrugata]MDU9024705.1 type VI secretion system-associated lipoprotein TagQ [Pseudomonas corrugata]MDU9032461.1 type VI secretion system-associated lipoprotein TagQ [Pseudomonas corrugata]MDU9038673.1 type VI secretion system-associated lipoprotein TagQ [Pseudomonas corrugata]QTH14190.1 type VI secretion-associated lipoprotein TagQ [Pseudomonas co